MSRLVLLLPLLVLAGCWDGPARVLVVGDSLSRGLYASTEENGYRSLLLDQLAEQHEEGVEPQTVALTGAAAGRVAEIADPPSGLAVAVVELGTNDIGDQTPLPKFRATYARLLDAITDESPDVALVCLGAWQGEELAAPYDAVISEECEAAGGVFRPLAPIFSAPGMRGPAGEPAVGEGGVSDMFHPNDDGHEAIAELVLDALGE